jgi:Immunity protein 53
MTSISKLCHWYAAHCVNEWHEEFGIKIETLDNPGWSLKIDIENTTLSERDLVEVKQENSDTDWLIARRNGQTFEAFGGPMNLDDMIEIFLNWAT